MDKWYAIGTNINRFEQITKLPHAQNINCIEISTKTRPFSTLTKLLPNGQKEIDLNGAKSAIKLIDSTLTVGNDTISGIVRFDNGYEHYAALNENNQLIFGGANYRGQSFNRVDNVRLFCCLGWSTAYLTATGEFGLTGFDFDCVELLRDFCQKNEIVNMAGGAHHIIMTSLTKVLIVSNRPDNVIDFTTANNITALHSSFFDCFIHF